MLTATATRYVCPGCGAAVLSAEAPTCAECRVRFEPDGNTAADWPRNPYGVPVGLPTLLPPSYAAAALAWSEGMLRGRMDRREIAFVQHRSRRRRYVLTSELARLEAEGWPVDWEVLADLAAA